MSLLMDALKKADAAKKSQAVPATSSTNESNDSSHLDWEEEELVLVEVTDDDVSNTSAVKPESAPSQKDEILLDEELSQPHLDNDFSLLPEEEPFSARFTEYPLNESEVKSNWDDEFLPQFQKDLVELENATSSQNEFLNTASERDPETPSFSEQEAFLDELASHDGKESIQPIVDKETETSVATASEEETTAVAASNEKNRSEEFQESEVTQESSPLAPPSHSGTLAASQLTNALLSPPADSKTKTNHTNPLPESQLADLEYEKTILTELDIKQELSRMEAVNQTKPSAQSAQRILAANASATASSKRTLLLIGLLGILVIGMGGGYYYYTQSSLTQTSSLKLGQLNKRLKTAPSPPNPSSEVPSNEIPHDSASQAERVESSQATTSTQSKTPVAEQPQGDKAISEPVQTEVVDDNHSNQPAAVASLTDVLANPEVKAEIAKLVAAEAAKIAKQLAAQNTVTASKPKLKAKSEITSSASPNTLSKVHAQKKKVATSASSSTQLLSSNAESNNDVQQLQKQVTDKINKKLSLAYNEFQRGNETAAYHAYHQVLQEDPNNRDALLGFAALAVRRGNAALARQYYQQVLQLHPQDTHAQVGLINTLDYQSVGSESQLKLLLQNTPQSAYTYFSLGNFYASQGRWAPAQQAYFDAYRYDSNQADYAYNLAVSLDQLNQTGAALNYYQRALQLAQNQSFNFSLQAVQKRVQTLMAHTNSSALANLATEKYN